MITATGCWNRRELNDLAVAVAVGFDKKGEEILLSDQILNASAISPKEGSSSSFAPITLFQESGLGLQETSRKLTTASTRKIYVGQLQMVIIGEELAREGVNKVLDHITRDHEYRRDFYVVVARGTQAQNILKVFTPIEKTPASKLSASLEISSKSWGTTGAVKIDEFISTIISKGKEAILSGIEINGSPKAGNNKGNVEKISPTAELKYSNLAVFKKDKLVGWLTGKESIGYNYTQGKIKSTVVLLTCPQDENHISVELLRTKSKIKLKMVNGEPEIDVKLRTEGVVSDVQCVMDLTNPKSIQYLESLTAEEIKKTIEASVKTAQKKYKLDIFGFGEEVHRKYPKYWGKVKANWNDIFKDVQVNVKVETKISGEYKTNKSISERIKR